MSMDRDLTDFLWLRVAEDKEFAERPAGAPWAKPTWELRRDEDNVYVDLGTEHLDRTSSLNEDELTHIARHDPTRTFAEVDLLEWLLTEHALHSDGDGGYVCAVDGEDCGTLRRMAALYADHDGYKMEWRP
ncbi:DUF6221 family protein [Streptomyces sp. NPDC006784]|uniref:DUF6221 family protein n=1 Tax=Streptomyces sp. NPDC006784 TaxID=3364764 RepID=UPI0036C46DD0